MSTTTTKTMMSTASIRISNSTVLPIIVARIKKYDNLRMRGSVGNNSQTHFSNATWWSLLKSGNHLKAYTSDSATLLLRNFPQDFCWMNKWSGETHTMKQKGLSAFYPSAILVFSTPGKLSFLKIMYMYYLLF